MFFHFQRYLTECEEYRDQVRNWLLCNQLDNHYKLASNELKEEMHLLQEVVLYQFEYQVEHNQLLHHYDPMLEHIHPLEKPNRCLLILMLPLLSLLFF